MPVKCRASIVPHCWFNASSIVYDAGSTIIYHRVWCILGAYTWHLTYAVSMLPHSFRCWPDIETALGDCTVFSGCCIMLVTFKIPVRETPDNTIHWPNADVMPGHCLLYLIVKVYFFWTLFNNESTEPSHFKRYIALIYKDHTAPLTAHSTPPPPK